MKPHTSLLLVALLSSFLSFASVGVDLSLKKLLITPEIHFDLATWGSSDEMEQNGQPGFFEIKIKLVKNSNPFAL